MRSLEAVTVPVGGPHEQMGRRHWMEAAVVTGLYAAVVVWGAAHHEPWRDEVVPLSIARHARSLAELAAPLKFEGHPILWYLVLWSAYAVVGRTWVLKVASVGSAVGAVFLLNRSPLPWWLRWLFTFSFFPIYQYSVISRGYSLEMLLLFAFCALYPRRRERPLALGFVLAALANTEAFGLIIAVAAGAMVVVEGLTSVVDWRAVASDVRVRGAAVVYLAGLALAAMVAFPESSHRLAGFERLDVWSVVAGVGRAIAQPAAHATSIGVLPAPSFWVWGYFVYLARRPPVLAFAATALIGIEALFDLVYGPGAPWHTGHVMLVLVATMWLDASGTVAGRALPARLEHARVWLGRLLAGVVTIVFAGHVLLGADVLAKDLHHEYSANRRLAELLRADPALANAVVTGEPDTPLWSLSYYADNRIYLPREDTFRAWGMFAFVAPRDLRPRRAVGCRTSCTRRLRVSRRGDAGMAARRDRRQRQLPRDAVRGAVRDHRGSARRIHRRDTLAGASRADDHR